MSDIMDQARAKVRQQRQAKAIPRTTKQIAVEVDLPLREDLAYRPFPVDILPEPIRGFVDAGSRAMGCDPCYIALPQLCAIGSMIGNTRRLMLKNSWHVPPIIWTALIGESGTLKSPAFRLALTALRRRQAQSFQRHKEAMGAHEQAHAEYERELATWKKSKTHGPTPVKPTPPVCERYVVNDVTIEALAPILRDNPRGVLLECDELAGWFGSFDRYSAKGGKGGGDSAKWLSIYSADSLIIDRKTGVPPTIHVPHPSVCVVGGIQPAILKRAFSDENRQSGLAARLLLAMPPRIPKKWTNADIENSEHDRIDRLFDRLAMLDFDREGDDLKPGFVELDREAQAIWINYYNDHNREQIDLEGDLCAAWSKLEEYAARLALILHFVRWASGEIIDPLTLDVETLRMGITLTEWFKHEARRVYAILDESADDANVNKLLVFIQRKGGTVTPREVQRGVWHLRKSDPVAALEQLKDLGWGEWVDIQTTENGGRPTKAFRLAGTSTHRHIDETPSKDVDSRQNPKNPAENRGFVDVETVERPKTQEVSSSDHQDHTGGSSNEQDDIIGI